MPTIALDPRLYQFEAVSTNVIESCFLLIIAEDLARNAGYSNGPGYGSFCDRFHQQRSLGCVRMRLTFYKYWTASFVEMNRQRELFDLASQDHDSAMVKYSKTSKRRETDKVPCFLYCETIKWDECESIHRQDLKQMLNCTWLAKNFTK